MKWASPADWSSLDLSGHCRVWTQDAAGTQRRMANRAKVWQIIGAGLNHLEGRTPRMLFCQAFDATTVESCNSNPTFEVMWLDNKVNSRERDVRIMALPRDSNIYSTNTSCDVYTNAASASNAVFSAMEPDPSFPGDVKYKSFMVAKGGSSNATVTEKISTTNGTPILDICCQERQVNTFDSALDHDFVFTYGASPGAKIHQGLLEDIRGKLHRLRTKQNRLVFCWLAVAESNAFTATTTGAHALATGSSSYVNVFDGGVSSRTATSPGIMAPGYGAGTGQSNSCGVQVYLLARTTIASGSGGGGLVKVIGPDHVANNYVELAVEDETATWSSSGPIYLNTESGADDVTTARNKFDIHFLANAGETSPTTCIYAILGFTLQT